MSHKGTTIFWISQKNSPLFAQLRQNGEFKQIKQMIIREL
jgi:hypothetical protein